MTEKRRISVLLVDDHPVVRAGYRRLLEGTDNITVVAEAESGEEGYRLFTLHQPDLVVMDLNMPGMGGLEALRRIRAREPKARLLVFSVHDNEAMLAQALKAGVQGYLSKRSAPDAMVEAIYQVMEGRTYIDPLIRHTEAPVGEESRPLDGLSPREFEVFCLLAKGHSVNEVAEILVISPKTAGVHHTRVMQKLGLSNRAQLVHLASQWGVL